ncbi:transcriptional regulator, LacI family [Deinococcus hopiensis KR-140]|uniref:Transcriptional regulator, LacI family n=2 Tax=Deinococcus TaxID=1298 RepID=A0A1W1UQQ5_9DEIO|nr:LacI family DNA-binding transcriptional regulator [Deinococcus hopiensis]SMB83427.1 transcriptional regulator, LacI family [Deinococcus hopiensis KR-140]
MARVTLKQVALKAGVSYQTVSNVLNNSPLVRPVTRDRVLQVIQELDYHPNFAAKALRGARTKTVALIFVDATPHEIADPYRNLVQAAVAHEANEQGYSVLTGFLQQQDEETFRKIREQYRQQRFDGAILAITRLHPNTALKIRALELPVVLFDHSGPQVGFPQVTADHASGMRELVHFLVQSGRRDLALVIASDESTTTEDRCEGFLQATQALGVRSRLVPGDWTFESGQRALHLMWEAPDRPDAVLCANDRMAAGCLAAARALGIRVPEDVSVTGYDDFEFALYTAPSLTTVHVPYENMTREAFRLLLQHIEQPTNTPDYLRLPVTLIPRESAPGALVEGFAGSFAGGSDAHRSV